MKPVITDISGIGPAAEATLAEHGFTSLKALARATVEQLAAVPGFSEARAGKVISAASDLLPPDGDSKDKKDKRGKKDKKDKKDKKGKRGKKDKKDKKGKKGKK